MDLLVFSTFFIILVYLKATPTQHIASLSGYIRSQAFYTTVLQTLIAGITLLAIHFLLTKTKFYLPPKRLAAHSKQQKPDQFFYYDNFVIFISSVYLTMSFVIVLAI